MLLLFTKSDLERWEFMLFFFFKFGKFSTYLAVELNATRKRRITGFVADDEKKNIDILDC